MKNKCIVITGIQAWNLAGGGNCRNIAIEFAKQNQVLFVNPPPSLFNRPFKREGIPGGELKNEADNLWILQPKTVVIPTNILPHNFLYKKLLRSNSERFGKEIASHLKKLNFTVDFLFTDSDMFRSFFLKEILQPKLFAYYIRDNLMGVPYWHKHGQYIETLIIRKADIVLANSLYLADYAAQNNSRSYFIGQGCDISIFNSSKAQSKPDNLPDLPRPVIGYAGALLSSRLDKHLIEFMCKKLPKYTFLFVGKEDEAFQNSELHQLPNTYFTGLVPPNDLPRYINQFDVAINPQAVNPITIGNYPRKIDEYLAMGKPVVATHTRAMVYFQEVCYLASFPAKFVQLIQQALEENNANREKKRQQIANKHDWGKHVEGIYATLKLLPQLSS